MVFSLWGITKAWYVIESRKRANEENKSATIHATGLFHTSNQQMGSTLINEHANTRATQTPTYGMFLASMKSILNKLGATMAKNRHTHIRPLRVSGVRARVHPRKSLEQIENSLQSSGTAAEWSDLGVAYSREHEYTKAKQAYETAIKLDPGRGASFYNLGNLELEFGNNTVAIACYQKAAERLPSSSDIYLNLGNAFREMNEFSQAIESYDKSIQLNSSNWTTHINKANILVCLNKLKEAEDIYKMVLNSEPSNAPALVGLGNVMCQTFRHQVAKELLERAISIDPYSAQAYSNLANIYLIHDDYKNAEIFAKKAIANKRDFPEAISNLGLAMKGQGNFKEAIKLFESAISMKSDLVAAYSNLALTHKATGNIKEALKWYLSAIKVNHNDIVSLYNAGLILLQLGEFKQGWTLYEKRWQTPNFDSTPLQTDKPRWDGSATSAKLLLWPEQGIGDEVMFAAMLHQVKQIAPNLKVILDKRLIPLFERSFRDIEFYSRKDPIPENLFDTHIPFGSLGQYFCNCDKDFNSIKPAYLVANTKQTSIIRSNLVKYGKRICGISWKSINKKHGPSRSINLLKLLNLVGNEEVIYVNLQYGDTEADIEEIANTKWDFISTPDIDKFNDIDGLCSLIAACDYVVSIDNSTVHFAGALGIPTTVLLPRDHDWRWTAHRTQSLWYPSVTYTS
jgi:tetratricopeptide (TPR) repeat protein